MKLSGNLDSGKKDEESAIWLSLAGLVLVAVLPLLVFGGGAAWMIVDQKKTAVADELAGTARALRVAVDRELVNQFVVMDVLASGASLDTGNLATFHDRALRAMRAHSKWLNVALIDPKSHKIVASGLPMSNQATTSSPAGVDQVARSRKPLIAGVFLSGHIVRQPIVLFLAPVVRDATVRYVLAVVMEPNQLSSVFPEQRLVRTWTGAIIDANMKIAGRSRDPERYLGVQVTPTLQERLNTSESGMFTALNQEGATVYTVFSRSALTGWTVAIGVPATEVEGPIRHVLLQMGAAGCGLIMFALFLSGLVGRGIVRRRKSYGRTLQLSESRLHDSLSEMGDLIARIPLGVYKFRTFGEHGFRFDYVSERWCAILGVLAEDVYRDPAAAFDRAYPDDLPELLRLIESARRSEQKFVWEGRIASGESWLHFESSPTLQPNGDRLWDGIMYDITRQKQMEAYKETSREVLQTLSGTADFREMMRQVLALLKQRTGFDAVGIRLLDRDDFPYFEHNGFSEEFLLAENSLLAHDRLGEVCRGAGGAISPECLCGLVITGRAGPEHPLCSAGGSFWSNDLAADLQTPHDEEFLVAPRGSCLQQGYASQALVPIRKQGAILGLLQLSSKIKGRLSLETVEQLEIIASHIGSALVRKLAEEERIKLEDQLQHAQKMESVGRLAGGVAHDFNNMLGVILGHANLALMDLDPTEPQHGNLTEILKAAERSADLTRQLLAFARKQTITPRVVDLNETVAGLLKMLKRIIGEDIVLDWQPDQSVWPVRIDPSQLDQILANLCINARDAIANIGKIGIKTVNCSVGEAGVAAYKGLTTGDYVLLTVSDNGCGMDHEIVPLIFEPYFTTKGTGKGTGLGLATVYGAVKQNSGFIYVTSEPQLGSTFSVFLPRHQGESLQQRPEGAQGPAEGGDETILLVEDELAILNVSTMLLTRQGYTVLAANSPAQALQLAEEHAGQISLLLTDVVMPEMNGHDLAQELLSRHPHLRRLFMSGFTADVIANHGAIDEGFYFIQKPFTVHSLSAKVREVLDAGKVSELPPAALAP